MNFYTLQSVTLSGKRAFVRTDYDAQGETLEEKVALSVPSIKYLIKNGTSVVVGSSLGIPSGVQQELSLAPAAKILSEKLGMRVPLIANIGDEGGLFMSKLSPGEVVLLENLKFYDGESNPEKDPSFVERLSKLADLYVNDAFALSTKNYASILHLPKIMDSFAAGFLLEKEILILNNLLTHVERPFYMVVGGNKIAMKIETIKAILDQIDGILIGGGVAFTFCHALGIGVGNSLVNESYLRMAQDIVKECDIRSIDIKIAEDALFAESLSSLSKRRIESLSSGLVQSSIGVDIGPSTILSWKESLKLARTIFWNGPLGICEIDAFNKGTLEIAEAISNLKAISIASGEDTCQLIKKWQLERNFTHVSNGGEATLRFIEAKKLPALDLLRKI